MIIFYCQAHKITYIFLKLYQYRLYSFLNVIFIPVFLKINNCNIINILNSNMSKRERPVHVTATDTPRARICELYQYLRFFYDRQGCLADSSEASHCLKLRNTSHISFFSNQYCNDGFVRV